MWPSWTSGSSRYKSRLLQQFDTTSLSELSQFFSGSFPTTGTRLGPARQESRLLKPTQHKRGSCQAGSHAKQVVGISK